MGDKSKIEWTDATWNPVTGCTKVSAGCKNCYAERVFPRAYSGREFTDVRCHPERLDQPWRWKKPRRIFVNSMSDLFHERIPMDFIDRVFATMVGANQHTYQVLTKRPGRMFAYFSERTWQAPTNHIWLGVSVEDQATADERIPLLVATPSAVRFVSYEPALGAVDFRKWIKSSHDDPHITPQFDWLIAGGESGPRARPSHPDWFRSARDQCEAAGVPYFFKQWGEYMPVSEILRAEDILVKGSLAAQMRKVGKKAAGHLLDGLEHREYP